jgi:hypothetical protein
MRTSDFAIRSVNYRMIERIDAYLVIPLAFTALVSGVAVSLGDDVGWARRPRALV